MPKLSEIDPAKVKVIEPAESRPKRLSDFKSESVKFVEGPKPRPSMLESGISGLAAGLTRGNSDEIAARGDAAISKIKSLFTGEEIDFDTEKEKNLKIMREHIARNKEANPITSKTTELVGGIAPYLAMPALVPKTLAGTLGVAGADAALAGSGYSEGKFGSKQHISDTAIGGALGAGTAGIFKGIGAVADKTGATQAAKDFALKSYIAAKKAPGKIGKKALHTFMGGVDEKKISAYLANPDRINKARSINHIKDDVDDVVGQLINAKDAAKGVVSEAKSVKAEAERRLVENLRNTDIPETLPKQVGDALNGIRKRISQQSSNAFDILQKQNKMIKSAPIKGYLSQRINNLKIGEALPDTPEIKVLLKYRQFLDDTGLKQLRPEELKRFLQTLDEDIAESWAKLTVPGSRLNAGDKALMDLRSFADDYLKEIREYAKAMAPLAKDMGILKAAQKPFSNEKSAFRTMRNLDDPINATDREALASLGQSSGEDFVGRLSPYETAKSTLGSREALQNSFADLPESSALKSAQGSFDESLNKFEPIQGLTQKRTQSLIQGIGNRKIPNIEDMKKLEYLSKIAGKDFKQEALDRGVMDAFGKDATRGGRSALIWGSAGAAAGSSVGGPVGGAIGAAMGTAAGGAVDKFGGRMTKGVLDSYLRGKRTGSVISINQLEKIVKGAPDVLGKYGKILADAAQKGQAQLGVTHHVLWKNDPEYKALFSVDRAGQDSSMSAKPLKGKE
jgi:hypothetical protein